MDEYQCTQNLMHHTLQHVRSMYKVIHDFAQFTTVYRNMNHVRPPVIKSIGADFSSSCVMVDCS